MRWMLKFSLVLSIFRGRKDSSIALDANKYIALVKTLCMNGRVEGKLLIVSAAHHIKIFQLLILSVQNEGKFNIILLLKIQK